MSAAAGGKRGKTLVVKVGWSAKTKQKFAWLPCPLVENTLQRVNKTNEQYLKQDYWVESLEQAARVFEKSRHKKFHLKIAHTRIAAEKGKKEFFSTVKENYPPPPLYYSYAKLLLKVDQKNRIT